MLRNNNRNISTLQESIIQILKYFGLFEYPLSAEEIHRFCSEKSSLDKISDALSIMLKSEGLFLSKENFYSIEPNPKWSEKRVLGNARANKLLSDVYKYVRIIKQFPFVEGIAISGSLSKYYAEEDADIDYFIIIRKDRLWIARTLLHLYKKLTFLISHQHFYCMNYFVDEWALDIHDQNIYTAIEIATLIPVFNEDLIHELKERNSWVRKFLPNESFSQDDRFLLPDNKSYLRKGTESIFNILFPKSLNKALMRRTDKRWRLKWQKAGYPMENYEQAFLTSLHISKNHPANYQMQVLNALKSKESKLKSEACEI